MTRCVNPLAARGPRRLKSAYRLEAMPPCSRTLLLEGRHFDFYKVRLQRLKPLHRSYARRIGHHLGIEDHHVVEQFEVIARNRLGGADELGFQALIVLRPQCYWPAE